MKSQVYFVKKPNFKEAMMTFAFKNKANWLEEGLSILSWEYKKVATISETDRNKIYKRFKTWNGNNRTKIAGHRAFTIGDVIVNDVGVWMALGKGWAEVPSSLWNKVITD